MNQKNIKEQTETETEIEEDPDLRIFFERFNWDTQEYSPEESITLKKAKMKKYMDKNNNSKQFTRMEKV